MRQKARTSLTLQAFVRKVPYTLSSLCDKLFIRQSNRVLDIYVVRHPSRQHSELQRGLLHDSELVDWHNVIAGVQLTHGIPPPSCGCRSGHQQLDMIPQRPGDGVHSTVYMKPGKNHSCLYDFPPETLAFLGNEVRSRTQPIHSHSVPCSEYGGEQKDDILGPRNRSAKENRPGERDQPA